MLNSQLPIIGTCFMYITKMVLHGITDRRTLLFSVWCVTQNSPIMDASNRLTENAGSFRF